MEFEEAPKQEGSSASVSSSSISLISAFEREAAFDLLPSEISSGFVGLASAAELVVVERVTGKSGMPSAHLLTKELCDFRRYSTLADLEGSQ